MEDKYISESSSENEEDSEYHPDNDKHIKHYEQSPSKISESKKKREPLPELWT